MLICLNHLDPAKMYKNSAFEKCNMCNKRTKLRFVLDFIKNSHALEPQKHVCVRNISNSNLIIDFLKFNLIGF